VRNDLVLDALTGVHTGLWDYRLRIMRPYGNIAIAIEKR
jgi:hypothetical protein